MESLTRSLNFELPHELHLDKYAQHILESSKAVVPAATPTALNTSATTTAATISGSTSSDILQKIGATLLNSIQLKKFLKIDNSPVVSSTTGAHNMDMPDLPLNHVVIDSTGFDAVDELQKQLEYDKFMNEVWIGIVLTLILISMVFCICSCFLYHQFRTWKRNYRSTVAQSQDSEAAKLHPDVEDPVPEYALVSGLPSYEAALELLHKTPKSCLIVYPSVFNAFNKHEKTISDLPDRPQPPPQQHQQPQHHIVEMTTPLLPASAPTTPTATTCAPAVKAFAALPTYAEANSVLLPNVTLTAVSEKKTMQAKEKSPATAATTALADAATATATDGLVTSHRCEMLAHRN